MYFPSGDYYVGDLCYAIAFPSDLWEALLTAWDELDWRGPVELTYHGLPVWDGKTAYGDGCFTDTEGRTYGVDSGSIGLLPVALCNAEKLANLEGLGHVIPFANGCIPHWDYGVFHFGDLTINTCEGDEEDEMP